MPRRGLLVVTFCMAATWGLSAQRRIPTAVVTQAQLREVFPAGAWFSPHQGIPLHFAALAKDPAVDPSAAPLGYVFWTTDLVPREQGYHGAIHILVGLDTRGILTGVRVGYNREPYGYFSVDTPHFASQFKGKSIGNAFIVGVDIDAVSRATLTVSSATRAIRDSARAVARALGRGDLERHAR